MPPIKTRGARLSLVRKDVVNTKLSGGEAIQPSGVAHWQVSLPFVPQSFEQAQDLMGVMFRLSDRSNQFLAKPPGFKQNAYANDYYDGSDWVYPGGVSAGPTVNGAHSAKSIDLDNLVPSEVVFEVGDYLVVFNDDFEPELKLVTAQCVSDVNGEATVQIEPAMRKPTIDNGPVRMTNDLIGIPFRMTSTAGFNLAPNRITSITIEGVEHYDY